MTNRTEPQGTSLTGEPDVPAAPMDEAAKDAAAIEPAQEEAAPPQAQPSDEAEPAEPAPPDSSASADASAPPFAPSVDEPSAAEREYRAALAAARALGMDKAAAAAPVDIEKQEAARLVTELGLDQPEPSQAATLPTLEEPEKPAVEEADEEEDYLGPVPTDGRAWYVLNTYSGHENRVKENLERRIASMDVSDRIHRVVVPTEEELEIRGGQRRQVQRKLLPGYVLVEMVLDNDTWYVVRNTPGVTGFVGSDEPSALPREEVKSILRQMRVVEPRVRVGFELGDTVRVTDGPFMDFMAQVDEINLEKGKVRALISMFGRETPVELDFIQVEKV